MSLAKTYPVIAVVLTLVGLGLGASGISHAANIGSGASSGGESTGVPFLAVPLQALGAMLFATPVVLLFVYDKNNGVLEYLISLGMTQRGIYTRYLKAALLVAVSYLLIFGALNLLYSFTRFGTTYLPTMLMILGIGALISVSTVAFIITMMMIFSSLQKARGGGNQPMAVTLGLVGVIPGYFIPFIFSFDTAIAVEVVQGAIIAAAALILILMSSRLIKREKFLP